MKFPTLVTKRPCARQLTAPARSRTNFQVIAEFYHFRIQPQRTRWNSSRLISHHGFIRRHKTFLRAAAILILAAGVLAAYLLRGGFRRFEATPFPVPPAAFTNWNDVLAHPRYISLTTFQTGTINMDACLNLDPASPKQADCDHRLRDLAVPVH